MVLLRIEAPHFVAGVEFDSQDIAINAAPILYWMVKRHLTLKGAKRWARMHDYSFRVTQEDQWDSF